MDSYDPMALPSDDSTEVTLSMRLYGIQEVDTINSIIAIKAELDQYWYDERLVW